MLAQRSDPALHQLSPARVRAKDQSRGQSASGLQGEICQLQTRIWAQFLSGGCDMHRGCQLNPVHERS